MKIKDPNALIVTMAPLVVALAATFGILIDVNTVTVILTGVAALISMIFGLVARRYTAKPSTAINLSEASYKLGIEHVNRGMTIRTHEKEAGLSDLQISWLGEPMKESGHEFK